MPKWPYKTYKNIKKPGKLKKKKNENPKNLKEKTVRGRTEGERGGAFDAMIFWFC